MNPTLVNEISFWIGLVGLVSGFFSIWYSRHLSRQSETRKRLVLDVGPSVSLVSLVPEETGINLSITYEREGIDPAKVRSLYLTFIRIGNLGREPIKADDIAPHDPLMLAVEGSRVLDIAAVETTRPVSRFQLQHIVVNEKGGANAGINFSFLDFQDGALLRLLTETGKPQIFLKGTIIGQPEGVDRRNYFEAAQTTGCIPSLAPMLVLISCGLLLKPIITHFHLEDQIGPIAFGFAIFFLALNAVWTNFSVKRERDREHRGEWPQKLSIPYWFSTTYSKAQRARFEP